MLNLQPGGIRSLPTEPSGETAAQVLIGGPARMWPYDLLLANEN